MICDRFKIELGHTIGVCVSVDVKWIYVYSNVLCFNQCIFLKYEWSEIYFKLVELHQARSWPDVSLCFQSQIILLNVFLLILAIKRFPLFLIPAVSYSIGRTVFWNGSRFNLCCLGGWSRSLSLGTFSTTHKITFSVLNLPTLKIAKTTTRVLNVHPRHKSQTNGKKSCRRSKMFRSHNATS